MLHSGKNWPFAFIITLFLRSYTYEVYSSLVSKWSWNNHQEDDGEGEDEGKIEEGHVPNVCVRLIQLLLTHFLQVPIIIMAHGTSFEVGKSIASKGFATLASLDAGFYGKGIYFTSM